MLKKIITALMIMVILVNPLIINAAKIDEYKENQQKAEK